MNKPIFSIIIPIFGRLNYARESIHSVINQDISKNDYEIILVEEKNYKEKISDILKKEFKEVKVFENAYKEGPGGNRQTGLSKAHGSYIVFLDSDDQMRPGFIKKMEKILSEDPKSSAVVCFSKTKIEKGFKLTEKLKLYPLRIIRDISLFLGYIFNNKAIYPGSFYLCQISHMMFRTSSIKNLRFNYAYRHGGEDWDFFLQTLNHGRIKIILNRLLVFRYSPGSSTDNPINRNLKWKSYQHIAQSLPTNLKMSSFYSLFLKYIRIFGKDYEK